MSLFESASLVVTPNGTKASKLYAIKPTDGSGDLTVVRATTATRVNSSGLIESVASNVPRLDYTNSTCPSILVEPQRTNLLTYSEEFDNASWVKAGITIIPNDTSSPDSDTNADKIEEQEGMTGSKQISDSLAQTADSYSFSFFAKKAERIEIGIVTTGGGMSTQTTIFDIDNGVVLSGNGAIFDFGNGWFRCVQFFTTLDDTNITLRVRPLVDGSNSYVGVLGYGFYIWGAQLEVGSYATSYIPTTTASVTRNADIISKTGISSLIGQTEGTLFVDVELKNIDAVYRILGISDNTTANRIYMSIIPNNLEVTCFSGGLLQFTNTSLVNLGRYKIALSYKINDFKLYVNGSLLASDNSTIVPLCPNLYLGQRENSSGTFLFNNYINSALLFKTALTDTELATITTL